MKMRKFRLVLWTVLLGMAPVVVQATTDKRAQPNIIVIVTDDQGYADLSAYAHSAPDVRTPNMDRLAARGVLFTEAYATAPVCSPSRAGWNTGRHQVRWDPKSGFNCGLPDGVPTLAELLKENGYATARIGKSDYSNDSVHRQDVREYPLNHGYDEFLGFCAHGWDYFLLSQDIEDRTPDSKSHSASVGPLMHNRGRKEFKEGYLTEIFTDAAIDFVDRHQEAPFYLTLAYNSVHHLIHQVPKRYLDKHGVKEIPTYDPETDGPYGEWFQQYIVPGKISVEEMRKYYLANLNCLDDNIGRFMDALDRMKLTDNTLVIFFSDNGGAPTTGAWNRPLAGAKFALWEGGIRVPFILSRPSDPHAGETWNGPVSALDVFPTCLAAAGIEIPDGLDGQPFPTTLEDAGQRRNLFWRNGGRSYAVRSGDWKLLHGAGKINRKSCEGIVNRPQFFGKTCLFNLKEDPGETRNLFESHPEIVERLQKLYQDWSAEVDGSIPLRGEEESLIPDP
jgi:arylsulfatase A-like enzyme